jgi:hypothetical protein
MAMKNKRITTGGWRKAKAKAEAKKKKKLGLDDEDP